MRGKVAIKLAITAFFIFSLLTLASLRMTYNDMREEAAALREEVAELDENILRHESDLTCDMDNAFVERIARERLGLCYPNEILMHYYSNEQ